MDHNRLEHHEIAERCRLDRDDLTLKFSEAVPGTPTSVRHVVVRVLRAARASGCPSADLKKVGLALTEALNNAILHGSAGDPKKTILVCCFCSHDKDLFVVVRDNGPGFDPAKVPDPTKAENVYSSHGRGLFLMRKLMDEVHYEEGGRKVVLRKSSGPHRRRPRS